MADRLTASPPDPTHLRREFTIAEAAERTGLSAHTLRYYERIGALREPPGRAASGHRRYTERDHESIG